jgi:hypothetical protein
MEENSAREDTQDRSWAANATKRPPTTNLAPGSVPPPLRTCEPAGPTSSRPTHTGPRVLRQPLPREDARGGDAATSRADRARRGRRRLYVGR